LKRLSTIDVHAHIIEPETARALNQALPGIGVTLEEVDDEQGVLTIGKAVYRPFPRGGWDIERRLRDMDSYGFDRQALSVCPQTVMYDESPEDALTASMIQNDAIAARVQAMPDRFLGLATVPLQAPEQAAAELARAMSDGGLVGAMLCTNIGGKNLDWPELNVFWAEAEARGAILLLHPPPKVAGADRLGDYYLRNFIGNPLDTTIAAACLVFGGVLERFPNLKFVLSHGGGFVPYQEDRWRHGWAERPEAKARLAGEPGPSLDRLYFDTILHGVTSLKFLVERAGCDRVMLGSDYPFDMGEYDALDVIGALDLADADREAVLSGSLEKVLPSGRS
jgi:aminocarboxymuconate-semialdehyde decarboxylase